MHSREIAHVAVSWQVCGCYALATMYLPTYLPIRSEIFSLLAMVTASVGVSILIIRIFQLSE